LEIQVIIKSLGSGITFSRYLKVKELEIQVIIKSLGYGITFSRYPQSQRIGNPSNYKIFGFWNNLQQVPSKSKYCKSK
jgi:hypothetical protein